MKFIFLLGTLTLSSGTWADELPSCATAFDIQTCPDGSGAAAAVKEAARLFRKTCESSQAVISGQPTISRECALVGKTADLRPCLERWEKQSRSVRALYARTTQEQRALEPIFNELLGPYSCPAAEQNKEALRELKQHYLAMQAAIQPVRDEGNNAAAQFHQAWLKPLLATKTDDAGKHFAGLLGTDGKAQPTLDQVASMGSVELVTSYRLALEVNFPGPKDTTISVGGTEVKVSAAFAKVLRLEGSGVLADGRMVNSAGKNYVFVRIIDAPYGLGSYKRTPLEPYRSIAVDPKVIPLGSIVFIYEARGMPLPPAPDGTPLFHDGYFRAIDIGSMINGTHIDVYAGYAPEDYRFIRKYFDGKTIHFYVLK